MKGHFSCGDILPLASLAKQDLYLETLAMALSGKAAAYPVHAELSGEVSGMVGGGVAPACLLHTVAVTAYGPKSAISLQRAADAKSLSGGSRTKPHAGPSHCRMRVINLIARIEGSQCRRRAINPTSCSGALEGKGKGGLEGWKLFFLPQICGNRFYSRLLHKESPRGESILV